MRRPLKLPAGGAVAGRMLDDSGRTRAMVWVMAIMLFLTVLAGALGLGMARAERTLARQLAGRVTVQIVEADPARRDATARGVTAALLQSPAVHAATPVDRAHLTELLKPWLGVDGADPDLPVPALIDVDLVDPTDATLAQASAAVHRIATAARINRHAAWMSPVARFLRVLTWLAAGLVALMAAATGLVVFLSARAGLDTHRDTIGVLHVLGSTDTQVARLFQRRIAIDALLGGLLGAGLAVVAVFVLGTQAAALGSDLIAGIGLAPLDWTLLLLSPLVFAGVAALAARRAVLGALGRIL